MPDPEHEPSADAKTKTKTKTKTQTRQKTASSADARTKKQTRQAKNRRSHTLIRKAYELSTMAEVDVFLGIRDRATGRVKTFCADNTGIWSEQMSHLVCPSVGCCCCVSFRLIV
jgi:SRF-type transcription factor (DNA-binding and dimerisation domain)